MLRNRKGYLVLALVFFFFKQVAYGWYPPIYKVTYGNGTVEDHQYPTKFDVPSNPQDWRTVSAPESDPSGGVEYCATGYNCSLLKPSGRGAVLEKVLEQSRNSLKAKAQKLTNDLSVFQLVDASNPALAPLASMREGGRFEIGRQRQEISLSLGNIHGEVARTNALRVLAKNNPEIFTKEAAFVFGGTSNSNFSEIGKILSFGLSKLDPGIPILGGEIISEPKVGYAVEIGVSMIPRFGTIPSIYELTTGHMLFPPYDKLTPVQRGLAGLSIVTGLGTKLLQNALKNPKALATILEEAAPGLRDVLAGADGGGGKTVLNQVENVLDSAGKNVPHGWGMKPSKNGGGMRFIDPKNEHNSIRYMPGDPKSPYPNSQNPYVRMQRNGQALDKSGNIVPKNAPEAHIPLEEFSGWPFTD